MVGSAEHHICLTFLSEENNNSCIQSLNEYGMFITFQCIVQCSIHYSVPHLVSGDSAVN